VLNRAEAKSREHRIMRQRGSGRVTQRGLAGSTKLLLSIAVLAGVALGVGSYALVYAKGLSYMSSDPAVCANCHIMQSQYESWQKSSHHAVAGCIDCHLPHGMVGKYVAKAVNGWNHSKAFTLQNFPEPIAITPPNARILQDSCLACHRELVHDAVTAPGRSEEVKCVHCHQTVGHGERAGLGGPLR
jgi:cytochrome c nitrite reductase small subunit